MVVGHGGAGPGKAVHGYRQAGTGRYGLSKMAHGQAGPKISSSPYWNR